MTKYVTHKHGLIIGSDNIFFITGRDEVFRSDYRSIVWAQDYHLENINSFNYHVQTPAQQLMWEQNDNFQWTLNRWLRGWLNREVGAYQDMWDTYSVPVDQSSRTLFFKRRTDALKLIKFVESQLKDIRIGD
jgi:hypothetical protein